MELVGSALGDQADLGAGRAPGIGSKADRGDAELLHRVQGGAEHAGEGIAVYLVVVVHAIHGDVALVGAAAAGAPLRLSWV